MAITGELYDLMSPDFSAGQIPQLEDAIGQSVGDLHPADWKVFGDLVCAVYDYQAGQMSAEEVVALVHKMMAGPEVKC